MNNGTEQSALRVSNRTQDKLLRRRAISKAHSKRWSDSIMRVVHVFAAVCDKSYASAVVPMQTEYSAFASHTCNGIQSVLLRRSWLRYGWQSRIMGSLDFMSFLVACLPISLVRVLPRCSYQVWSANPRFVPSRVSQRGKLTATHPMAQCGQTCATAATECACGSYITSF